MKAFTDYFGEVEQITLLEYDGDKYVNILRENGEKTSIKSGYCFKNPSKYDSELREWVPKPKFFSKYVWWKLEGKKKEDFIAREKDWYSKWYCVGTYSSVGTFKNKAEAIKVGVSLAKSNNEPIELGKQNSVITVVCYPDSNVVAYDRSKRTQRHKGFTSWKYMKGYGKVKYRGKRHGRKNK